MRSLFGAKIGQRSRLSGPEDNRRRTTRIPMERVGGSEQDDLRGAKRTCQMHRRGIDGREQARSLNERSDRQQIQFSREIGCPRPEVGLDLGKMLLFQARFATGKSDRYSPCGKLLCYFRPTAGKPEFFRPGRAWVNYGEIFPEIVSFDHLGRTLFGDVGQFQMDCWG